jgi:chromosome segregation protein
VFKLKRIELLGFKSFADRTRLDFSDGPVAIVGPNGCGKSNLADAISWVLGEQSARMLRGDHMADVIFNGTGTRPPTGLAEVSMTLVDPDAAETNLAPPAQNTAAGADSEREPGAPPPEDAGPPAFRRRDGEIVVTRRLFRSGESDYLINGEACRLRDIQDLFMGTGLGPESYAIIEQGRIGQILSSKPSDRRAIIEEAAGISKFKTRKRLAEAKLESSRQNLARITDILEEVAKQVNSLKRQAAKARRHRELSEELKARLKVVLTAKLAALSTDCDRLREALASLQREAAQAAQELDGSERELKAVAARGEELEGELTARREQIARLDLERERLTSRVEQARQQAAALAARAAEAQAEQQMLLAELAAAEESVREVAERAAAVWREWEAAEQALSELAARHGGLAARLAEAESRVECCRREMLEAMAREADLRHQLAQAEETGAALERQAARAAAEKAAAEQEQARMAADLETLTIARQREEASAADLARSASAASAALAEARDQATHRRAEADARRQELSQIQARRQALEESLARHAYSTESVRRLLSSPIPSGGQGFRPLGVLADFVEVSAGYEELVENFLHSELDCVVVEEHEEAARGLAMLRNEGSGRSTFFVTRFPSNGHDPGGEDAEIRGRPGVLTSVRELVRFEARLGLNGDVALPALARAYVVADATTAQHLAGRYPAAHFLTPKGEHYHHRLVSGGKGASSGPLAVRREFRELERRAPELAQRLARAEEASAAAAARVERLEEELRHLSAAQVEAEKKSVVAQEQLRQALEGNRRVAERLDVLQREAAAIAVERQNAEARRAALEAERQAAVARQRGCEANIAEAVESAHQLRAELDHVARARGEAQAAAAALRERRQGADAERSRLEARVEEIRARLERLAAQSEGWAGELQRLERERADLEARAAELEASQQLERETLERLEQELRGVRVRREALTPAVEAARARLDAIRERRSAAEVALARADSDRQHHAQQCRDELGVEPAALLAAAPDGSLEAEALSAAEEELRALKSRLENLGPVNMMALEELQAAEDRLAFLETQRQDLLASIEDTTQAIREIDQVSRRRFIEAFQAINQYFAESFRTLFGGGIGQMRLTDESDPDSGIDLVAQPPGKRLQNVLLLSGGEKALAALALLMAVFRFTPSPFCVLDEVDAPLDDSNVERFTRMIRQMTGQTQFVLITHNKRTMEICPVMYGVTMEEPGVSKLVSVKLADAEPEPAVARG